MVLPAFGKSPQVEFDLSKIRIAESRLLEAKMVNPITYAELESCFMESFRDLKRHLTTVTYQLALAEKAMEQAKAEVLIDKYPEFLKSQDMKKSQDNADLRKAFLMRDEDYLAALDRINMLKAMESNFDGKIKVMENVCRVIRKSMDLILRSGLSNADLYVSPGRK